jgi:hypothetical protein
MNTTTLAQEIELANQEMEAIAVEANTVTVILTQVRENYGTHAWDGEGEVPQYWKNKGGSVYIFEGVLTSAQKTQIEKAINSADDHYEECVVMLKETNNPTQFYDEWEEPLILSFEGEQLIMTEEVKFNDLGFIKFEMYPGGLRNKV